MSHTLIIFLPQTEFITAIPLHWVLQDEHEALVASGEAGIENIASEAQEFAEQFSVVVIVPAESVLLSSVEIPSTQLRQIRQALPFMVEELIADDIDNVHTAIPAQFRERLPYIDSAIVEHKQLVDWLDLLHTHALSPSAILIDVLCLPFELNGWTLLVDGERLLIRNELNYGLAVQLDDAELMLQGLYAQQEASRQQSPLENAIAPQIQILASLSEEADCAAATSLAEQVKEICPDYTVKPLHYQEPVQQLLCYNWYKQQQEGINLLQGGYAVVRRKQEDRSGWGQLAMVASIGVLLFLVLTVAAGWYFNSQAAQLEDKSIALYRELFPNERRVVNPRRQMDNHLRQQGSVTGGSFLVLLAETAKQMQSDPDNSVAVRQIRFNNQQGDLKFELYSQSLEQLDQFKTRLATGGLQVDINSASEQAEGVLGRVVVRAL